MNEDNNPPIPVYRVKNSFRSRRTKTTKSKAKKVKIGLFIPAFHEYFALVPHLGIRDLFIVGNR